MDREDKQSEQLEQEIGSLPRVEAPVNFEQMVRTRIAEGRPQESSGRAQFMLVLKFALPTLLLMVFGAFLIFSGTKPPSDQAVAPIDEQPLRPDSPLTSHISGSRTVAEVTDPAMRDINANSKANASNLRGGTPSDERGGGSVDLGVKGAPETIYPDGLDPRARKLDPKEVPTSRIPPSAILSMLSMQVNCSASFCTVAQVSEGGPADRYGVKTGDVIEQINGIDVDDPNAFSGHVSLKSLTVRRAGKQVRISLQN